MKSAERIVIIFFSLKVDVLAEGSVGALNLFPCVHSTDMVCPVLVKYNSNILWHTPRRCKLVQLFTIINRHLHLINQARHF